MIGRPDGSYICLRCGKEYEDKKKVKWFLSVQNDETFEIPVCSECGYCTVPLEFHYRR